MYKTTDGGNSWQEIDEGICARKLFSLIVHPGSNQTLFAGGQFSVYKTTNGGDWSEVVKGFKILKFEDFSDNSDKNLK
ncbi:MAG TPA: hypothetical protein ENI34_03420 [candidate division WOR-3 bacterium]|uniref:Sortilin N-terminal domain-containing protein n=1 Tax=candidate division WOR-3 bacterium TaxID=2052148 RepID=A0A9C9JZR5_UNCW3|nr:hypothetical protein [candidate division WOR-3 bacterium]